MRKKWICFWGCRGWLQSPACRRKNADSDVAVFDALFARVCDRRCSPENHIRREQGALQLPLMTFPCRQAWAGGKGREKVAQWSGSKIISAPFWLRHEVCGVESNRQPSAYAIKIRTGSKRGKKGWRARRRPRRGNLSEKEADGVMTLFQRKDVM